MSGRSCGEVQSNSVNGQTVAKIRLAVSRSYKGKDDEWKEKTSFIDCEAWGKLADSLVANVNKGTPLLVSGSLESDEWEQDGAKRSKIKVAIKDYSLLAAKSTANKGDDDETPRAQKQRGAQRTNNGNQSEKAQKLPF